MRAAARRLTAPLCSALPAALLPLLCCSAIALPFSPSSPFSLLFAPPLSRSAGGSSYGAAPAYGGGAAAGGDFYSAYAQQYASAYAAATGPGAYSQGSMAAPGASQYGSGFPPMNAQMYNAPFGGPSYGGPSYGGGGPGGFQRPDDGSCRDFKFGRCARGAECRFAHVKEVCGDFLKVGRSFGGHCFARGESCGFLRALFAFLFRLFLHFFFSQLFSPFLCRSHLCILVCRVAALAASCASSPTTRPTVRPAATSSRDSAPAATHADTTTTTPESKSAHTCTHAYAYACVAFHFRCTRLQSSGLL